MFKTRPYQDIGAESRKKRLLCQRSTDKYRDLEERMKSYIQGMFKSSFTALGLEDMDAMMYLFREKTSLRRWKPNRVAFMNCMFSNQIITAYGKFDGNRRVYKVDKNLLEYGRGELPYHGSTGSVWSVDVDRLYIPICVNQIHWISMCVNLVNRTIEVFDCGDKKKDFNVKQYTVSYVPMRSLNKSGNDCGAYSLKFIECHLLGLDIYLVNDENIQEARHKIAFDLWDAANDEVLQYRMSLYFQKKRNARGCVRSLCFQSGCLTPLRDVAPNASFVSSFLRAGCGPRSPWSLHFLKVVDERLSLERVPHPAAGRRSEYQLHFFFLCAGCGPRSVLVAPILERCRRGVGSERVPNPAARGRAAFVSSGASVVGHSHCPLRCSTRSNNTFHSLFDPKCLQVPPRTPMDTPTPDKDLCNAKRKVKCIIPNLNDQSMQE
ncbi:hypothetical protein DY000_02059853 [Brassica cretica]|uniref:Ubiquitin-like protease family profile domain-containing protein n=1 Tax=Brassica cretica TaxID=69181 RepID=A0ABQ7AZ46_BRACR|nr:hypothetical protein DY000_02059853 [Brassica cretica]